MVAIAGCLGLAVRARRSGAPAVQAAREAGAAVADAAPDASPGAATDVPVALVSFVLTNCSPGAEAYEATILDLAARGFLAAGIGPEGLKVAVTDRPAGPGDDTRLTAYERQVLAGAASRLAGAGGAPLEAVADACRVDVRGTWEPFVSAVRADARRRGLSRPVLPVSRPVVALSLVAGAGIAASAWLIARLVTTDADPRSGAGGPVVYAGAALLIFWAILRWLARHDTLTARGSALAETWTREGAALAPPHAVPAPFAWIDQAGLRRAAFAAAASTGRSAQARAILDRRRQRPGTGPPKVNRRPSRAWSSFSGTWRPVDIRVPAGVGTGRGFALLAAAAWAGLIAFGVATFSGSVPLALIPASAAAGLAVAALRVLARFAATPSRAAFDGQVIARWEELNDAESGPAYIPYIAVDDAQQAWAFTGPGVHGQAALGDLVRVTVNPRSGQLVELVVTAPRPARPA